LFGLGDDIVDIIEHLGHNIPMIPEDALRVKGLEVRVARAVVTLVGVPKMGHLLLFVGSIYQLGPELVEFIAYLGGQLVLDPLRGDTGQALQERERDKPKRQTREQTAER